MAAKKAAPAPAAAAAANDDTPTPEEARKMFEERPDLASVLTTEGRLTRDGSIGGKTLGLDGIYR